MKTKSYFYVLLRLGNRASYACHHRHRTHASAKRCGKEWMTFLHHDRANASFTVHKVLE